MTTLVIDDICSHDDLVVVMGSEQKVNDLVADNWGGTTTFVRSEALRDVLRSLARRVPPVFDTDLNDATEDLREVVAYRALALLYRKNVNQAGDHFHTQAKHYDDQYVACLSGLKPSTPSGTASSGIGCVMERR